MKQQILQKVAGDSAIKKEITPIKIGQKVKVHYSIVEGEKRRIQAFEGIVVAQSRNGFSSTFTVRKVSFGIGVERIFPTHSPLIDKIEVVATHKVRRAKLFFLRDLSGKAARLKVIETRKK